MSKKRTGRPSTVTDGESRNVFLPGKHVAYVAALAKRDYLSFSAAIRLLIERDMKVAETLLREVRP